MHTRTHTHTHSCFQAHWYSNPFFPNGWRLFNKLLMTTPGTHPVLQALLLSCYSLARSFTHTHTHTHTHTQRVLSGLTKRSGGQGSVWIGWTGVAGGYSGFGGPPAETQPPTDWKHLHQKPPRIEKEGDMEREKKLWVRGSLGKKESLC